MPCPTNVVEPDFATVGADFNGGNGVSVKYVNRSNRAVHVICRVVANDNTQNRDAVDILANQEFLYKWIRAPPPCVLGVPKCVNVDWNFGTE